MIGCGVFNGNSFVWDPSGAQVLLRVVLVRRYIYERDVALLWALGLCVLDGLKRPEAGKLVVYQYNSRWYGVCIDSIIGPLE